MKRFKFLLIVGTLLSATTASGDTIYNNTIPSGAASGFTGSQHTILIDDVLVPSSRNPSNFALAISSITVELSAAPGDSGQFSLYLFPVKTDGTPAPNFALIDTTSVVFTSSFQLVTFGTGAGTLFTVDPNFTAQPGFGLFYVGLSASSIPAVDWVWANGPDANLPTAYLDNLTADQIFLNISPGPPFPSHVSYYMAIDGSPVSEPTSVTLTLAGIGLLLVMMGKRITHGRPQAS